MSSIWPWWWLALPLLLLPIWWHRQKRQRWQAVPLATASFLPASVPKQQRIWRWTETLLLILRCLLLSLLIFWLSDSMLAWRGDTVVLGPDLDPAWRQQQISAADMGSANQITPCATSLDCPSLLNWLTQHEREWRPSARLLILANADQMTLPAVLPQFAYPLMLRVNARVNEGVNSSPATPETLVRQHRVTLITDSARKANWEAMFAAFEVAGKGTERYIFDPLPNPQTELLIWDDATRPPPANWRAPLWWIAAAPELPEFAQAIPLSINGVHLRYADSARGRFWFSTQWPARDAPTLRQLYLSWQILSSSSAAYPATNLNLPAAEKLSWSSSKDLSASDQPSLLSWLLMILFVIERGITYARRA